GIMLWYGALADVPAGWALCNGSVYSKSDGSGSITSPDLRDRFIVGAGSTYAVGGTGGATSATTSSSGAASAVATSASGDHNHTGSTDGHTLSTSEIPSHRHQQNTGQGSAGAVTGWNVVSNATTALTSLYTEYSGGGGSHSHGLQSSGTHTHTVDVSSHTHTVSTMSPYYALAFIMKL
ncbi:MAG TPA: tail fiber protein, partial [Gemmatimonadales bacterium]|nr:tail fiber protein [Gemmatimonadales bacterium]